MKTIILGSMMLLSAASCFAQGVVTFNNRNTYTTHVYSQSTNNPTLRLTGNSFNDSPSGNLNFAAAGMTLIGAHGTNGQFGAATTFAQLLGANGWDAPESSLRSAATPPTTFRTGGAAGNVVAVTAMFTNIPDSAPAGTFEMVVWDNSSGQYPSWELASAAWQQGLIVAGRSDPFNVQWIGGRFDPAPFLSGLQSFNLYALPTSVTAPPSLALRRNSDGTMTVSFSGTPGAPYLIQAATDLGRSDWTSISTNVAAADGSIVFTDTEANGYASRMYRVLVP